VARCSDPEEAGPRLFTATGPGRYRGEGDLDVFEGAWLDLVVAEGWLGGVEEGQGEC
jgi:hypothetical protein